MSNWDQWSSAVRLSGAAIPGAGVISETMRGWMTEEDRRRIEAYGVYDRIYWNDMSAYALIRRGSDVEPIVLPRAMAVVDSTSDYFLKDFTVTFKKTGLQEEWDKFSRRELFYPRFHIAKHSGVTRGDFIYHITADPDKPEGKRVSFTSIDPAQYFPMYDDDDIDELVGVKLAYQYMDQVQGKDSRPVERLREKIYRYVEVGGKRRVEVEEVVKELDLNYTLNRVIMEKQLLEDGIEVIPVYHFQNKPWQGLQYGSSELRGHERILAGTSQSISDEELALALEGLGVWTTDSGKPQDANGNLIDWEIAPARVMEVVAGGYFKRAEGIRSVQPVLDHVKFLEQTMFEATRTFRAGELDKGTVESGIARQLKFSPTLAKLEIRDAIAKGQIEQMMFDWSIWQSIYESGARSEDEPEVTLGEKLPLDTERRVTELNNMFDRKIITRQFYRDEMEKMGYQFPDDIEAELEKEAQQAFEKAQQMAEIQGPPAGAAGGKGIPAGDPKNPNAPGVKRQKRNRNKTRLNESNGSETGQSASRQARGSSR